MENSLYFEKLLKSFEHYYSITQDDTVLPFDAHAEFVSKGEQYILVKAAKIAQIDTNEFVYFKNVPSIDFSQLQQLAEKAWDLGQSRIKPYYGHKNSDITLIVIADKLNDDVKKNIKKIKFSKSYKCGLYGWSNFKLAVKELSSSDAWSNRLGSDMKKLLYKI